MVIILRIKFTGLEKWNELIDFLKNEIISEINDQNHRISINDNCHEI